MKRLSILSLFVLATGNIFAAVGTHNFVIKAGGGLAASTTLPVNSEKQPAEEIKTYYNKLLGGVVAVDLGYQYFGMSGSSVHGVDLLAGFGMNFDYLYIQAKEKLDPNVTAGLNRPYGYISSTYSAGLQFSTAKLMFDVLGINLSLGTVTFHAAALGKTDKTESGGAFGVGVNLPLGIQYVANNGFVFGFRHTLNFLLPAWDSSNGINFLTKKSGSQTIRTMDYINYNLIVSVGYMFGK